MVVVAGGGGGGRAVAEGRGRGWPGPEGAPTMHAPDLGGIHPRHLKKSRKRQESKGFLHPGIQTIEKTLGK